MTVATEPTPKRWDGRTAYDYYVPPQEYLITPEDAKRMLEHNVATEYDRNRTIRWNDVHEWAIVMKRKRWQRTHQGIAFRIHDGVLIDGQHRLLAIVEAGVPVVLLVTFGMSKETRKVVDVGIRRRPSDILHMRGATDTNMLAGGLRLVKMWKLGFKVPDRKLSPDETDELYETYKEIEEWVPVARRLIKDVEMTNSPALACAYVIGEPGGGEWIQGLTSGANLKPGDPRLALARVFRNARRLNRKRPTDWQMALYGKAYNAWLAGKSVGNVMWREDESFPKFGRKDIPDLPPISIPPIMLEDKQQQVLRGEDDIAA